MRITRITSCFFIIGWVTAAAQTYTISVLAGNGSMGSADGMGNNARFSYPTSLAVDSGGYVYVADTNNNTIRRITPAGLVTTLAGMAGTSGSADGTGSEARFSYSVPALNGLTQGGVLAVAVDRDGNVFVADSGNHTIRKITPNGVVTTLAGLAGSKGNSDGTGSNARFSWPSSLAVDRGGNLFVVDSGSQRIRKITPAGVVTTFALLTGFPESVTLDSVGNLYVASYDNTVRKITPAGVVMDFAGLAGAIGNDDGPGRNARFGFSLNFPTDNFAIGLAVDSADNVLVADPGSFAIRKITPEGVVSSLPVEAGRSILFGIAVDRGDNVYLASFGTIRKGVPDSVLAITAAPQSQTIAAGSTVVFTAAATGASDRMFQWWKDGAVLSGATNSILVINKAADTDAGQYTCVVTDSTGSVTTTAATLMVLSPADADVGRLVNFAIRSNVGSGAEALIMGVTVGGTISNTPMPVLIRGVGPSLAPFGVTGFLADPVLTLFREGTAIAANDNWGGDTQIASRSAQVGAFRYASPASLDAALATALAPSSYSIRISSNTGATGIALGEFFEATPGGTFTAGSPRLINLSARKQVGTGADMMAAGFVISGQTAKTVLIRAIGPSLAAFGVSDALPDPKLQLFADSTTIRENDDWGGDVHIAIVAASVGAFALSDPTSKDAALLVTLPPGNYTALVSGSIGSRGLALVEIYEVP